MLMSCLRLCHARRTFRRLSCSSLLVHSFVHSDACRVLRCVKVRSFIQSFRHCCFCSFRTLVHVFVRTFDHSIVPFVPLLVLSFRSLVHSFPLCIFRSHVRSLVRSVRFFPRCKLRPLRTIYSESMSAMIG